MRSGSRDDWFELTTNGLRDIVAGIGACGESMFDLARSMMWTPLSLFERGRLGDCGCSCGCEGRGCGGCASGCDIPPPPWAPQSAGSGQSFVCPGQSATIRVKVRNCSGTRRQIKLEVGPRAVEGAAVGTTFSVTPSELSLGPLQEGTATVRIDVSAKAAFGSKESFLIWVLGCRARYLCWTVHAVSQLSCGVHEVEIAECEDFLHHWYDHFYCEHPCVRYDRKQ